MTEREKLQQISTEYEESRAYLENRKLRWVDQIKLMNNLNRGDENISATMMFSYVNRVVSNLYEPKIQVKFEPNEETDMNNVEKLNKLAVSDFQEMQMEVVEYDWTWDAVFYARGYLETINFNKKKKILVPEVINPLMFGYDPYFEKVQEWRYYWKWKSMSGAMLSNYIADGIITGITKPQDISSGMDPQVWNYKVLKEQPKYVDPQGQDSNIPDSGNGVYQILEHFTYFDGKKTAVWTDKGITKILREEELDLNDDTEHEGRSHWPIVVREVFHEPHSSVAISVPDLIEDKHRAKSVIMNLAYIAAKDEATPIYVAKEGALTNPGQLLQRQINQHIMVEDSADTGTAIQPLKKSPALSTSTLQMLNILGNESADAIGTTQISPVVQKGKKTATGDALQQQISDLTASLQSKIIGGSEKQFWTHWYQRYVNNMKEGDVKLLSVTNSQFTTFEQIQLDDIKTNLPPKAIIFSAREAEFKESVERRELAQQFGMFQQVLPPEKMTMFLKYIWFPKFQTFDSETINLIFPKSADEIKAEQENEMIANGVLPPITETDNHELHLFIHSRVKNNAQKWAHVLTHETLMSEQQAKQAQAAQNSGPKDGGSGSGNAPSASETNPQNAATPVKSQMSKVGKESKINSNIKK